MTTKITFDLAAVVNQSRWLWECLDSLNSLETVSSHDSPQLNQCLLRWCEVVAPKNLAKFEKRLRWDRLDLNQVNSLLEKGPIQPQPLPPWAITLQHIVTHTAVWSSQAEAQNLPIESDHPLPFEEVLLPVVLVARQKLLETSAGTSGLKLLTDAAYRSLERNLLQKLVTLCARALETEFERARPLGQRLLSQMIGSASKAPSKDQYDAFVQTLLDDQLQTFFQTYPVLGRLLATVVDFWIDAITEFIQNLKSDLLQIQQIFEPAQSLGAVTEIKPALSDPHHQGRTVLALTFASGLKLIYKPKGLGLEATYNQFLDWCNQQDLPLPFRVLKVINRGTYGWMEYVEQQPCADESAAQRFYQRAGMLLCVLYVLRGTDCHAGNLIASGEHLQLIDLEALMQPEGSPLKNSATETALELISEQALQNSVMRTGLLPRWQLIGDSRTAFDISGLGSVASQLAPRPTARWQAINTDQMYLALVTEMMPAQANVPMLNGAPLCPHDYLEEIISGFQQMYRFLVRQRAAITAPNGPLAGFAAQPIRFVFRNTDLYHVVLHKTLAPEFLQSGLDFSIELDILSRALLNSDEKPAAWAILQAEFWALAQLDMPYFGTTAGSQALCANQKVLVEHYFPQASYHQVIAQIQALDETDLAQQAAIIRGAFYARVAHPEKIQLGAMLKPFDPAAIDPLTPDELLLQAQAIADTISGQALQNLDGSVSWLGLEYVPSVKRVQLQLLGESLYNGGCGIALFLAAHDYVTGKSQWRELVLATLQPLRRFLKVASSATQQAWATQIGIGGATGIGSILYTYAKLSQFLQEPELATEARQLATLISPELIAADLQFDILGGAAGAILGLLAVDSQTHDSGVVETAVVAGHHLLQHRISVAGLDKAWKTSGTQPLTGLSHGAAGIAYVLLKLYQATQEQAFLAAATEAITYEQQVFVPTVANWPDFRAHNEEGQPKFQSSWCHGAPGIGLARLGSLGVLNTDIIQQEIEIALETTLRQSYCTSDHLCCGNFGRVALLTTASETLARPELLTLARGQAGWIIARAVEAGSYRLFLNIPNELNLSFFQGIAGIGYQLLRLAQPELLPEVLLWQ